MYRLMLAAAAVAVLYTTPLWADDKDKKEEKPKDRAEQLRELKSDMTKKIREVVPEWSKATTPEDKEKALCKMDPIIDRGLALVAENPKDDVAFDTLTTLLRSKPK